MSGEAKKKAKEWLDENRPLFMELKKKLEDPKRIRTLLVELYQFLDPILAINGASEPHAAMFAIGQIKGGIEAVFADIFFYQEFLRRQAEYDRIVHDESGRNGEHSANPGRPVAAAVT